MAENVLVLKKRAVAAGMPKAEAMKASRATLENFLSSEGGKPAKKKVAKKKAAATPAAKKKTAKAAKKNSKTAAKKSAPAAKKSAPTAGKAKRRSNSDGGRNMVAKLDFTKTDGWNPREDSAVMTIFKAIKKAKGDVDKATDALMPNAKEYVSTKNRKGEKRTKAEIQNLLRYRVNRTRWEFARRTGQHLPSENRVEYGTGAYATARKKADRKQARKTADRKPAKKTAKRKKAAKK